jgi:hypothetical protein
MRSELHHAFHGDLPQKECADARCKTATAATALLTNLCDFRACVVEIEDPAHLGDMLDEAVAGLEVVLVDLKMLLREATAEEAETLAAQEAGLEVLVTVRRDPMRVLRRMAAATGWREELRAPRG